MPSIKQARTMSSAKLRELAERELTLTVADQILDFLEDSPEWVSPVARVHLHMALGALLCDLDEVAP